MSLVKLGAFGLEAGLYLPCKGFPFLRFFLLVITSSVSVSSLNFNICLLTQIAHSFKTIVKMPSFGTAIECSSFRIILNTFEELHGIVDVLILRIFLYLTSNSHRPPSSIQSQSRVLDLSHWKNSQAPNYLCAPRILFLILLNLLNKPFPIKFQAKMRNSD